jgi:signal transduction histidine kinase
MGRDITKMLIKNAEVQRRIGGIFPDYVILDNHFNMLSLSQNVLQAIGFSLDDIIGQSVSMLSRTCDLKSQLEERLSAGYFEDVPFEIFTRTSGTMVYSISGFYLGLVADINGVIVLRFRNLDEINLTYDRLEARTAEIDRFVYLSAHALRGPLATIKGLTNLVDKCKDRNEMLFLLDQIRVFSEKLDDKLHRLIYFAEADKEAESSVAALDLDFILTSLKTNLRDAGSVDFPVSLECFAENRLIALEHGGTMLSLLRNITLFFAQLPKERDNRIVLDVHVQDSALEIMMRGSNFTLSESIREKLRNVNFGYSEILNFPELINCYAAKKIMFKLKGNIQFILANEHDVIVHMIIPR